MKKISGLFRLHCRDFSVHFIPESSSSTFVVLLCCKEAFWHWVVIKKTTLGKQTWQASLLKNSFETGFSFHLQIRRVFYNVFWLVSQVFQFEGMVRLESWTTVGLQEFTGPRAPSFPRQLSLGKL